jgi:putative pyruvate formate lyase activating enzyme
MTFVKTAYLNLPIGEIRERCERAVSGLENCRACPRDCGVNRLEGKWGACKTGRHAVINSHFAHMGEEDCIRGWRGSGTIFVCHCNLRCVFCQNYDISQGVKPGSVPRGSPQERLAAMMLELQQIGCHNINFVTPEHVVPQLLEALVLAIEGGLTLPLVYNTSAYDSLASLALLDGIVDIYMPDLKFWSKDDSRRYLKAENYPEAAFAALKEMHRQVGPLSIDSDGLATRGVLIRHLVMPGMLENTRLILEWIAAELAPNSYVNLMDQYRPAGKVNSSRFPEIDRRVSAEEYGQAIQIAKALGLRLDKRALR